MKWSGSPPCWKAKEGSESSQIPNLSGYTGSIFRPGLRAVCPGMKGPPGLGHLGQFPKLVAELDSDPAWQGLQRQSSKLRTRCLRHGSAWLAKAWSMSTTA